MSTENGNGDRRRAELADFLRQKRAALQPDDVGLPTGGRRRTPGLRREEVALLAGVGTTWYTWLEQGRDVRASLDVFEAVARALKLSHAERTHLILLGRGEDAPAAQPPCERATPAIRRLIASLEPSPAYLVGRRWDYLAWNRGSTALFGDFGRLPPAARNHLWQLFTDPYRRTLMPDWAAHSRLAVAKFRADSARHVGEPAFEELVDALRQASPEFARMWKRHEVAHSGQGRKDLRHPDAGLLKFEHAVFHPTETIEQRLVLYSPVPGSGTAEKLRELIDAEGAKLVAV